LVRRFLLILALSLLPGTAVGMTTYSTLHTDLLGVVDFLPSAGGRAANFDYGQQFSNTQNVWIELDAHVVAREFDVCGTAFSPQPRVHEIHLLGFFARLDQRWSQRRHSERDRDLVWKRGDVDRAGIQADH